MLIPSTTGEELLFTTVRIESRTASAPSTFGTGFFFNAPDVSGQNVTLLVTNKHVVTGSIGTTLNFHSSVNTGDENAIAPAYRGYPLTTGGLPWIDHPDANVDLCACLAQPLVDRVRELHVSPAFYKALDAQFIFDQSRLETLLAIEDVVMVGYPEGLWDRHNNMPLVRRGTTASHPCLDFEGRSEGAVDIGMFPGSSGSPLFLYNSGVFFEKGRGLTGGTRVALLGVLYGGPARTNQGTIHVESIPTTASSVARFQLMSWMHLGYYVKAREVKVLSEHVLRGIRI